MDQKNTLSALFAKKALFITALGVIVCGALLALVTLFTGFGMPEHVSAAAYNAFQVPAPTNAGVKITAGAETRLGTHTLEPATPPPFYDFLVPDVCLDASGNPTSQDPTKCTKKRNLRIGESLPYLLSDFASHPDWNQIYQHVGSFPMIYKNEVRIAQLRDFGANSGHPGAFRDFDRDIDGYDILSSNGSYVSAIGTRDPETDQPGFAWTQPDCSMKDSWIFFSNNAVKGVVDSTVAKLKGGILPCTPTPNAYSTSMTVWNWYDVVLPYTSNKQLESIQSWHHSGTNPTDATKDLEHMEVFRFTKEFGLTRWEGWTTEGGAMSLHKWTPEKLATEVAGSKMSKICDAGDPLDRFGYLMYRWGCRDWSFVSAPDAKRGPITPYSVSLTKDFASSANLITMNETKARADAAGGSLLGWKTLALGGGKAPKLSAGSDASTSKNLPTTDTPTPNNKFYKLECTDTCGASNPRSMYIDVNPDDIVKAYGTAPLTVQAGGLVRGPENATNATLAVHMLDAKGAVIASRTASVGLATATVHAMKITGFSNTAATQTIPDRLNVLWSGMKTYNEIPGGSQVLIGDKMYTTVSATKVGYIYLPANTTGLKVGDAIKYIQKPDGTIIYNDIGNTPGTGVWKQVRFNFDWDFTAKPVSTMRYEMYVRTPGEYHLDEAFMALLPQR